VINLWQRSDCGQGRGERKTGGRFFSKFLTAEEVLEPDENLSLEERITRLEHRVAQHEAIGGAVG